MVYEFREWKIGDWAPTCLKRGSYVLICDGEQVAVMFGPIFNVMKMEVKPEGNGYETEFIKRIIEEAREAKR